jgi:predicted acylesterase/phospholipase RssA
MDDIPIWLALPFGFLTLACAIGGAIFVFGSTYSRRWWAKWIRAAFALLFPPAGFLLLTFVDRLRRRRRAEAAPASPDWKWIAAHMLAFVLGVAAYLIARDRAIVEVGEPEQADYRNEWWFRTNQKEVPDLCVAMSGGGIRSAAFNIGVLRALHEKGILARTDVMSAVSGGSYALSWYLLQQYYAQQPGGPRLSSADTISAMFDWNGVHQYHLAENARQFRAMGSADYYSNVALLALYDVSAFNVLRLLNSLGNENLRNASWARQQYRESLQNTFHIATHPKTGVFNQFTVGREGGLWQTVQRVSTRYAQHTNFSVVAEVTFSQLAEFARQPQPPGGRPTLPFFVFVTKVDVDRNNPSELWPRIFELNGWGLGSDSYGYTSWKEIPEREPRFAAVRLVNVAPAISGAALSPASGGLSVNTQRLMEIGNVDLGYRVPRFKPDDVGSLYLSDGGHAENLGLYPLVRRNCQNIIVIDAEHEASLPYAFDSYTKVRNVLRDETNRTLAIEAIDQRSFDAAAPVMSGTISAAPAKPGSSVTPRRTNVIYVKLAMDKSRDYGEPISNPSLGQYFPQDPTSDQNFDSLRFRAYRELGYVIARDSAIIKDFASGGGAR